MLVSDKVCELSSLTIYPVTGASGGAILNPWLKIPTQFVSREPCHNNILKRKKSSLTFNILYKTSPTRLLTWDPGSENWIFSLNICIFVCLFVLRFYSPVNTIKVMLSLSVNLSTLFLGRFHKQLTSTKCSYFRQKLTTALLESTVGR